jgi:DNA-binding beta-propeller fold protein YncE
MKAGDRYGNLDISIPRPWPSKGYVEFPCAATKLAMLHNPRAISLLSNSNTLIIADENAIRSHSLDTSMVTTIAGRMGCCCFNASTNSARFTSLQHVASSLDGNYAYASDADSRDPLIRVNVLSGMVERRLDGSSIGGIAENSSGLLVFANAGEHRIETYNWQSGERRILAGSLTGTAGFRDGPAGTARFNSPFSLARSPDGRAVFVVDQPSRATIRRVDLATGDTACWAGTADTAGAPCRFPSPNAVFHGLAVSPEGTLLAVDRGVGGRVLSFRPAAAPTVETLAGGAQAGYVDGAAATAQFSQPAGLDITPDGQMVVVSESGQGGAVGQQFPRVRAVALCSGEACPWGQWRGPCNAAYRGRCVNCSLPPAAHYTAGSAQPFRDACDWVCDNVSTQPHFLHQGRWAHLPPAPPSRPCRYTHYPKPDIPITHISTSFLLLAYLWLPASAPQHQLCPLVQLTPLCPYARIITWPGPPSPQSRR